MGTFFDRTCAIKNIDFKLNYYLFPDVNQVFLWLNLSRLLTQSCHGLNLKTERTLPTFLLLVELDSVRTKWSKDMKKYNDRYKNCLSVCQVSSTV